MLDRYGQHHLEKQPDSWLHQIGGFTITNLGVGDHGFADYKVVFFEESGSTDTVFVKSHKRGDGYWSILFDALKVKTKEHERASSSIG